MVVLMSLSLIGIIFVQSYWINKSVSDKEEQFSNTVNQILSRVVDNIEKREVQDYLNEFYKLSDSIGKPKATHLKNFSF